MQLRSPRNGPVYPAKQRDSSGSAMSWRRRGRIAGGQGLVTGPELAGGDGGAGGEDDSRGALDD